MDVCALHKTCRRNVRQSCNITFKMGKTWRLRDIRNTIILGSTHLLALLAPFHYNAKALAVAGILTVVTGLFGVTLCYHRLLSHASLKLPKWLEYFFAYCGVLAFQGDPIEWVSYHRHHHKYPDMEKDPHSPIAGFWFSHMGWFFEDDIFYKKIGRGRQDNVGDLKKQIFYRFLEKTQIFHITALGLLLYAAGGLPYFVWGMGVRIVYLYHSTFCVASVCHLWGSRPWKTGDNSTNNWWVAIMAFGEGWHNNHHAFLNSARQGLEWWQIDTTWYAIRCLKAVGLATDVRLPNESQKERAAISNKEEMNNSELVMDSHILAE